MIYYHFMVGANEYKGVHESYTREGFLNKLDQELTGRVDKIFKKRTDSSLPKSYEVQCQEKRKFAHDFRKNPQKYVKEIFDAPDQLLARNEVVSRLKEKYEMDSIYLFNVVSFPIMAQFRKSSRLQRVLYVGLEVVATEEGWAYKLAPQGNKPKQ